MIKRLASGVLTGVAAVLLGTVVKSGFDRYNDCNLAYKLAVQSSPAVVLNRTYIGQVQRELRTRRDSLIALNRELQGDTSLAYVDMMPTSDTAFNNKYDKQVKHYLLSHEADSLTKVLDAVWQNEYFARQQFVDTATVCRR